VLDEALENLGTRLNFRKCRREGQTQDCQGGSERRDASTIRLLHHGIFCTHIQAGVAH
jgi:hypothetical protein